jgi:glycosyltransferase involved in cell wall biosynthesis
LHYLKGLDILIDCFEKLKEEYPHVKLKVVGSGEMEVIWKERIQSSGLSHIIELYGKTSRYEEVFEHLRNAYALLVPSRADNFPNVIIEAFACGVPVIASKSGGIPEMLTDGVNGFLCECENQNDWMKKIEYLIRERKCRNTMAVNARRQYEEKFTMERHVNNVSNFLETL